MSYLVCDLGSYSLKLAWAKISQKKVSLSNYDEIIYPEDFNQVNFLQRIQFLIDYLTDQHLLEVKIALNLADHLMTSRYISIPIGNKKKALQMLPFQLDDQLPQSIESIHYSTFISVGNNSSMTISQITSKDKFTTLYELLDQNNFFPALISSNLFYLHSNLKNYLRNGAIIDIGHKYSHFYAIKDGKLITDETYHFGGFNISEMITQVYDLSVSETEIFKHRNSFFLTKLQYQEADSDQVDFAKLMEKISAPLLTEINRWRLSVRVNSGLSIDKIYLTGGSSSIKNICEYLQEQTGVEFILLASKANNITTNFENKYFNLNNCAQSLIAKQKAPHFLSGEFSSKNFNELPLVNLSLIFSRSLIFATVVIILLLLDTFLLIKPEIKKVTRNLNKLLKRTSIKVTRKEKRLLRRKPEVFYKNISKQESKISSKLAKISSRRQYFPLQVLNKLSSNLKTGKNVYLKKFTTNGLDVRAQFQGSKVKEIKELEKLIKLLNYQSTNIKIIKSTRLLELKYRF